MLLGTPQGVPRMPQEAPKRPPRGLVLLFLLLLSSYKCARASRMEGDPFSKCGSRLIAAHI
eukprot:177171-Pyramimonas_sp.AAC.1